MTVLSLPALRRLRFPLDSAKPATSVDQAGRTVLAALGLCAAALAAEKGFDLRSRCLLWPSQPMQWELLDRPGQEPRHFVLEADAALKLLRETVEAAEAVGLKWRVKPLQLEPSPQLVALVKRSQELVVTQGSDEEGGE